MPGDREVDQSAFDVVTDSAGMPAARAAGVEGHRVAVEVSDASGVGGIVDRQAQLDGSADRVGDEVRDRGRRDGRVRHGSWSGWMVIRHLHPVTAGSFYIPALRILDPLHIVVAHPAGFTPATHSETGRAGKVYQAHALAAVEEALRSATKERMGLQSLVMRGVTATGHRGERPKLHVFEAEECPSIGHSRP